jgi:hypothetical protein
MYLQFYVNLHRLLLIQSVWIPLLCLVANIINLKLAQQNFTKRQFTVLLEEAKTAEKPSS